MSKYWSSHLKPLKVLWLGFAVPDSVAQPLFALDPSPAIQTHKFGWSFARALRSAFGQTILASSCPVQSYPLVNRLIFRGGIFNTQGMSGILLGFLNVILLKHLTRLVACLVRVAPLVHRHHIEWIFIHGLHTPYLFFGLLARLTGKRVAVVLTDPPGVVLATDGGIARSLKKLDAWLIKKILRRMDAVLALAPKLAHLLAPERPTLIFPGILESTLATSDSMPRPSPADETTTRPFTIVYAGGLSAAYGVDRLIDAIRGMEAKAAIRLKLFGRGDQEEKVRQWATSDPRIVYGGFVDAAALLPELWDADLLINPRPTTELFASLSFPSKLIEYLATGRPVLTTRIASIPEALKVHYHFIDDESADGIRIAIQSVMQVPPTQRTAHALAARQYARTHLSEEATGQKIAEFIASLHR